MEKAILVDPEEAAHLQQVLRLRADSPVIALDGRGKAISGKYLIRDKKPYIEATEKSPIESRAAEQEQGCLVLEVALMKGDAMSWVIEKAVELGARKVVPILTDHAVVQVDKKGADHFMERWQRIADQALKQCERLNRLTVTAPVSLEDLLKKQLSSPTPRLVALEPKSRGSWPGAIASISSQLFQGSEEKSALIGPEGGWSAHEINLFHAEARAGRLQGLDLGPLVLRAETAALLTLSCSLEARLNS
ncbi:MAG: 16S rRNA (uracil(1498)-N(3))-methyltransferase [Bdellovibrionales bacterium]|nr:16S rRNA (uracil(1498)-N(3))-methyltransferase [Bdellovibrionales bacterium]